MDVELVNVLIGIGGIIISALLAGLGKLAGALAKKIENEYAKNVLDRARESVQTAVLEVKQTYVDSLKDINKDGKFSMAEEKAARAMVAIKVKKLLGPKGLKEVSKILGAEKLVEGFIRSETEATVAALKKLPG